MQITKYGHACLLIEEREVKILLDPGAFSSGFEEVTGLKAILITHQHEDHCRPERIAALLANNPDVRIYTDEGSATLLREDQIPVEEVRSGDIFEVEGVKVEVIGSDHAVIHPDIPIISNAGYLVAEKLFYPGDSFTLPGRSVAVLALPAGAPWLKLSEAVDYLRAVKPTVAVPVHDAVLAMPEMHYGMIRRLAPSIELRVIENGSTITI